MSKSDDLLLAKRLRAVYIQYAKWETGKAAYRHNEGMFCSGICKAVAIVAWRRETGMQHSNDFEMSSDAYSSVELALRRIYRRTFSGGYLPGSEPPLTATGWQHRAWMCLFMAEWLENEHS